MFWIALIHRWAGAFIGLLLAALGLSGTLLLFTVHDRMSYGLVVESTIDMRVGDYIKHPSVGHRDTGLATSYGS